LKSCVSLSGRSGVGLFDENLRKEVGDGKNARFCSDPWEDGEILRHRFNRLFDVAVNKEISLEEVVLDEGVLTMESGIGEEGCFIGRKS